MFLCDCECVLVCAVYAVCCVCDERAVCLFVCVYVCARGRECVMYP